MFIDQFYELNMHSFTYQGSNNKPRTNYTKSCFKAYFQHNSLRFQDEKLKGAGDLLEIVILLKIIRP